MFYFYVSKKISSAVQEFANGYLNWFSALSSCQKNIFPRNVRIFKTGNKIVLNYSLHDRSLKYFHLDFKNKIDQKRKIKRYIYNLARYINTSLGIRFKRSLLLHGIGYQFAFRKNKLLAQVGFSHTLVSIHPISSRGQLNRKKNLLRINGYDLAELTGYFSQIRKLQKPDVYKGKGIRYLKEFVRYKEGKKKKSN